MMKVKINQRIKEQQQNKDSNIKNNLFQNKRAISPAWMKLKHVLFSNKNLNKTAESDKSPYLQDKQKKNFFPYILLSIGLFNYRIYGIYHPAREKGLNDEPA